MKHCVGHCVDCAALTTRSACSGGNAQNAPGYFVGCEHNSSSLMLLIGCVVWKDNFTTNFSKRTPALTEMSFEALYFYDLGMA